MTTMSSGNGASADGGGSGSSGGWGWFSPAPATTTAAEVPEEEGRGDGDEGDAAIAAAPAAAGRSAGMPVPVTYPGRGPGVGAFRKPEPEPASELEPASVPGLAREPGPARQHTPKGDGADRRQPGGGSQQPSRDAVLIRRTMEEIEPRADKVTAYFYALLFVQHPQLRDLFPASMDTQRDRLFKALLTAVGLVDDTERLTEYLSALGRGHRKYGTRPEHYPAVGECLIGALTQYAPDSWSDETEAAWVRAYTVISQVMIDAAAEDERKAPAWWNAEVVAHERRTSDIAVLTVRPDQPYPFLAGQYAGVETPWWPRVWRPYSFAGAPRPDGLLTFHIKGVPAGWVSNALVNRARPGDVLRLGPPAGSMTVDHTTDRGLLCVGGGTGIAPVKALVEDVAEHGGGRPVEVFYGARNEHDLYDLATMLELERRHSWLSLRPVVSYGPGPSGVRAVEAELPDAVRMYGPWEEYEGYLAGPPGLIRNGVNAMAGSGIPAHRIRHDAIGEMVAPRD